MDEPNDESDPLGEACDRDLGDPDLWYDPDGYPGSLALCIIDSIYSTGAHYSSVVNVVRRYRDDRTSRGGDANNDGAAELLANFDDHGGSDRWASAIGNRRPTSTKPGAPLKAAAIVQIAKKLSELGIPTTGALRAAAADGRLADAKAAWTATPGQSTGITWEYALMLAGVPGVKADRMVVRYVARALGRDPSGVSASEAATLVRELAERRNWGAIRTDHAIWRFESGRPVNREGDPIEPDDALVPPRTELPTTEQPGRDLAKIVIDAVSSPGVKYESVKVTLNRYHVHSAVQGRNADTDGITELIASFDDLGGAEGWASTIGNRRRKKCAGDDLLVAEIVLDVARRLDQAAIQHVGDLRGMAADGRLADVEAVWRSAPCQGSGVSWGYALLLAGVE